MVAHTEGDHDAALEDLTRALELVGDDPDLLHNRGHVHQSARHWDLAARDYARALELPGASREELVRRLDLCRTEAGLAGALRDSSRPLAPALRGRG
jgi:predicted TPR repeat methyltransferase